jgi:acetyl esterase/lipase
MSGTPAPKPVIDPELAVALAALPKGPNGKLMDLADIPALQQQQRKMAEMMAAQAPPPDPRVAISAIRVRRADGSELGLRLYRPAGATAALPALAYFHPGGQVMGEGMANDAYAGGLCLSLGCVLAAVDYRVAPQTPAPGAAEDGLLAYTYLTGHASELGIDSRRIGLAGASGGGAPAAAVALMVRDQGIQPPCLLSLNYAMLDDRNETPSSHEILDIGIWDRQENELAWKAVLGDRVGAPDLSPYCAPGRATDLYGLPPAFIAVGQFDVFRDEDIDFALRLIAAGVPVDLHVYGTAYHSFDLMAPATRLAREFTETWHTFLRRELHS